MAEGDPGAGNKGGGGGARLRDVPASLGEVNELLQDITTKVGNLSSAPFLQVNVKPFDDISRKMEQLGKLNKKWADTLGERAKNLKDISKKLHESNDLVKKLKEKEDKLREIEKERGKLGKRKTEELENILETLKKEDTKQKDLLKGQEQISGKWETIGKLLGQDVLGAVDKIAKSMISLGLDAVIGSLALVKKGFMDVYDLVDRSVKASGEFAMSLGAMSSNMEALQKEGQELEGTLRGLSGGELGIGKKELAEAAHGFGFLDDKFKTLRQSSVLLGREFGIGSQAAGELTRQFYLSGESAGDLKKNFQDIADAANAAGVPVADFTKEIQGSTKFMASFGKKGRQVFLDSATYAKNYGLSIKSLEGFNNLTDTFEGAAGAASKMNAVFGTSINALELMLNDSPEKRLEMVRKALVGQGKTWDQLRPKERRFLADTTQIAEDELQGLLTSKMSYADLQKKKDKAHKREMSNQQMQQAALHRTAMTVLNVGAAWDSVTAAFKPLFDDLLGKDFFGNLSKNVGLVIGRIKELFGYIRENADFQAFIKEIREDFSGIFDMFRTEGPMAPKTFKELNEKISTAVTFFREFYDLAKFIGKEILKWAPTLLSVFGFMVKHYQAIIGIWAAAKVAQGGFAAWKGVQAFRSLSSVGKKAAGVAEAAGEGGGGKVLGKVAGGLKSAASSMIEFGKKAAGALWNGTKSAASFLVRGTKTIMGGLASAGKTIAGSVGNMATGLFSALKTPVGQLGSSLGGKLGIAGALIAAAAAGYEFGTWLRETFPQIDNFVQAMADAVTGFFSRMWKAFKESALGQKLGLSDTSQELRHKGSISGLDDKTIDQLTQNFEKAQRGELPQKQLKVLQEIASVNTDLVEYLAKKEGMSVEAINQTVTTANAAPATVSAPQSTSAPKNYAKKAAPAGGKSKDTVTNVINLHMDSQQVARAVVTNPLSDP